MLRWPARHILHSATPGELEEVEKWPTIARAEHGDGELAKGKDDIFLMVDVQKIDRRCADMSPGFCIQREAAVAGAQGKSHIPARQVYEVAVSSTFYWLAHILICHPLAHC